MKTKDIIGDSVDELVVKGLAYIKETGEEVSARGLQGLQAYNVNYILTNPRNRVHTLREPNSVKYLAREILAFLNGSLKAVDMAAVSKFWLTLADENGNIGSNYGHHVFHQKTPEGNSQYDWVVNLIQNDRQTRRGIININQVKHKLSGSKDMPCNIAMHFFIQENSLCCVVSSRSTDVITGLPYNMGFFSFITELMWVDLRERGLLDLKLGYCAIKSNLTQLYDDRIKWAQEIEERKDQFRVSWKCQMPPISSADELLKDIYNNTQQSETTRWCVSHS